MRAPMYFEKDVMRQRRGVVGAALLAIAAGVAAFVIGLSQPTAETHGEISYSATTR